MDTDTLLRQLLEGNHQRGGLRVARLFDVKPDFRDRLEADVFRLIGAHRPSNVHDPGHISNWWSAPPKGEVFQFSLLNRSGQLDDTTADHDGSIVGKRFQRSTDYPTLAQLIAAFPHSYNFRINLMAPSAGLPPHKEQLYLREAHRRHLRVRFHLPIQTNPEAEMLLDGEVFHFEPATVYFFNNGCVHTATNKGETPRLHLLWDMRLTPETARLMFGAAEEPGPDFLCRVPEAHWKLPSRRTEPVNDYDTIGGWESAYRLAHLDRLGVSLRWIQRVCNESRWYRFALRPRVRLADVR